MKLSSFMILPHLLFFVISPRLLGPEHIQLKKSNKSAGVDKIQEEGKINKCYNFNFYCLNE